MDPDSKLAKISMLDQDPDTNGPKMGKNHLDTKCPKSGYSNLPSKGIIMGPTLCWTYSVLQLLIHLLSLALHLPAVSSDSIWRVSII